MTRPMTRPMNCGPYPVRNTPQVEMRLRSTKSVQAEAIKRAHRRIRGTLTPDCTICAVAKNIAPKKAIMAEKIQGDILHVGAAFSANKLLTPNQTPTTNSVIGYRPLMQDPQSRQRPRRKIQLTIGILSQGRMEWLQQGQRLPGRSRLSPRGKR